MQLQIGIAEEKTVTTAGKIDLPQIRSEVKWKKWKNRSSNSSNNTQRGEQGRKNRRIFISYLGKPIRRIRNLWLITKSSSKILRTQKLSNNWSGLAPKWLRNTITKGEAEMKDHIRKIWTTKKIRINLTARITQII